ncbi:MAG: hypothetical protein LBT47_14115 [Deltaproteobacteria bacterium]|jgi:response regulator RpfG family c-di-GMP phosphodiesterase|nr:hypothetical protein [Deltaproteobacteria bacterium]
MFHDVGKISFSDALLKKNQVNSIRNNVKLFEAMKRQPTFGAEIIDKITSSLIESDAHFLEYTMILTLTQYEKWDDTDYPNGLAKETIPSRGGLWPSLMSTMRYFLKRLIKNL